jgi:kynurenine formamidase
VVFLDQMYAFSTLFTVKDHGFYVQRWNIVTQYGTHIDAPIHFVENKRYLEDIDLKELVLPLIVLDFVTMKSLLFATSVEKSNTINGNTNSFKSMSSK